MAYPIQATASLSAGESASVVTFRPAAAGLVTVTAICEGDLSALSQQPKGGTEPLQPNGKPEPPANLEVRIQAVPPGSQTPAINVKKRQLDPEKDPTVIVWGSGPALDTQLSGDWTVTITNTGNVPVKGTVTVRYQTVPGNLGKIDHIIVLMMENRSFDHMLGYLSLSGGRTDVDGLHGTEFNENANSSTPDKYSVHHLATAAFLNDPGHGWTDVKVQLTGDAKAGLASNAGFASNFDCNLNAELTNWEKQNPGQPPPPQQPVGDIMGYYDATDVPIYDFLAREFTICQPWFASLPADTFPNRSYALTGGLDPQLRESNGLPTTPSDADVMKNPPAYTRKTIFEFLRDNGVEWNIFFDNGIPFGLLFKNLVQDAYYTRRMRWMDNASGEGFFPRAKTGDLPPVAWIDPYFSDVPHDPSEANDDHAPGDITEGQYFIASIYNALATSPAWAKTLFVVTYDEHGGFFDHVLPPGSSDPSKSDPTSPNYDPRCDPGPGCDSSKSKYDPAYDVPSPGGPQDDNPAFMRYGLRVPAIVVSPWVQAGGVSKTTFDHTSILRTILLRFCTGGPQVSPGESKIVAPGLPIMGATPPSMGKRTDTANDLGSLLSAESVRDQPPEAPGVTAAAHAPIGSKVHDTPGSLLRAAVFGI